MVAIEESITQETTASPMINSANAALAQLNSLLESLSDSQYRQTPVGVISSSIGGHVRHCLDHFASFLNGLAGGIIDYDCRERGTPVERSRVAALNAVDLLIRSLRNVAEENLEREVCVRSVLCAGAAPIETASSLGRELIFTISHLVHHNALLAAMCRTLGVSLPDDFGYAPATLAHHKEAACAPSRLCA